MKKKISITTLVSILFYLNGVSQNDSVSVVNKSDIKSFHKSIFQLSVDSEIDSSSSYTLRYSFEKGWTQGPNNPNPKKKYKSKHFFESLGSNAVPIARILSYPTTKEDSTDIFLNSLVAYSKKDDIFKNLKKWKFDDDVRVGIISLGSKYLLVAKKTTYMGNTSWSTIEYLYYEKVE